MLVGKNSVVEKRKMVRCNTQQRREIYPQFSEGGEAGHDERIRNRVWSHLCTVDEKRSYNDTMRSGCLNLSDPFSSRMWKAHHDVNLMYSLSRINNAQQHQDVDRYCGWEPTDLPGCQCSWRTSTGVAVEPGPGHPSNGPVPHYTRSMEARRQIKQFQNDPRKCLQATAVTADGPVRFAWPDTVRPLTLATFGRDADADWCLYKNPVRVIPISVSRKEKVFLR